MSLDDLLREIDAQHKGPCRPGAWHSTTSDDAYFWFEGVPYYAQCVDPQLTLYRADDDGRIVGVEASRISQRPDCRELLLEIERHGARACVRLLARMLREAARSSPDDARERWKAYEDAMLAAASRFQEQPA